MIKKTFVIFGLLFFAGVAHADDSAFPRIDVRGIAPGPLKGNETISFYGKNASDFMKMLPAVSSVDPKQDAIDATHHREITLMSRGLALQINCSNADYNGNSPTSWGPVRETKCDVSISKSEELEGDSFEFKPVDAVQPLNKEK